MRILEPSYEILKLDDGLEVLKLIELAGRTCYKSEDKITDTSALEFIKRLLSHRPAHLSVIEHSTMTVKFVCERGFTHELVRHRLVSYSQESTRYCNYAKGKFGGEITVIEPLFFAKGERVYQEWKKSCEQAEEQYFKLLDDGAKPEEARSVLPTGLKTEIVATANLRQWGHIFFQRTSPRAHPQMRQLMVPLCDEVQARVPVLFDDISIYS